MVQVSPARLARLAHVVVLASLAGAPIAHAQIVRKVLIIGVDGMRPDAMLAANAPNFDALIAQGAFSSVCQAEDITISGPCWSTIVTGVHRNKHGVTGNSFAGARYDLYPHFFKRLQEVCDARTVSIVNWSPINTQITQQNADVIISGVSDANVAANCASVLASSNPDVIFLHFDEVDGAGHANGFSPTVPNYLAAIERTDTYAGQVLAAVRARPSYASEDWLVIVTSDHGGTPDGSHGQNIPEHRNTPLIVSGLSSARGTTIPPGSTLADVPATVMTFLGVPINPAWGWDGQPVGLNMAGSPSVPFDCEPPPPPPVGACCLQDGSCIQLTQGDCTELRGVWAGLGEPCPGGGCEPTVTLASENFDGVPLGPNVDESTAGTNVWSEAFPPGWVVDRSSVPPGGVTEWRGWSVASQSWWTTTAGDQGRAGFTKGVNASAIADPDEWDDLPRNAGLYDTTLTTPAISLANARAGTARLFLDSSWRQEANQSASITVRYDGGAPVTLALWTSAAGPNFKPDAVNETLSIPLNNPIGAQSMTLSFRLFDAGNNWWWALDNLQVVAEPLARRVTLLAEDFESVPLGSSVDELPLIPNVWSGSPPAGWVFDDSGVPAVNDPSRGVTEWEGWAITNRPWWAQVAGDQNRSQFTRGVGAIAVADPDEWDDRGTPSTIGPYNAKMVTRDIDLTGIAPGSLQLSFDSSWRPEAPQRADLAATFSDGSSVLLLNWSSVAGPTFKPDATNERLSLAINNPAGATSMRLVFRMLDARNNWWWGIDNLLVSGEEAPCRADFNQDDQADFFDYLDFVQAFAAEDPAADFNADGQVDFFDYLDFASAFDVGC
ncbi:MAG: alkaline phosphatase family protein [Planctomycetota bacterium]|nr:alkaline phosphatase family protein [Planctomycetota bacterium]